MTMHMLPVYYTTTRYNSKKRKRKISQKEIDSRLRHQKFLEKMGVTKSKRNVSVNELPVYIEDRSTLKTSDRICGFAPKKESLQYTGTLIKGIATMHKSNAVPITDKKQAVEVSQMRRN